MAAILLTHIPDMLANYYGARALAELRKLGDVRLNDTGKVLDAAALTKAARDCQIVVSDRQTPGPATFFTQAPDVVAFLRVAVDIRNSFGRRNGRRLHGRLRPQRQRLG